MSYFSLSPDVEFTETDLTTGLSAVATAQGASAGQFEWGPVNYPVHIFDEASLISTFGKSTDDTYGYWYPIWNFLQYVGDCLVARALTPNMKNAVAYPGSGGQNIIQVLNPEDWETNFSMGGTGVGMFAAKYPGSIGNSIKVSIADATAFKRKLTGNDFSISGNTVTVSGVTGSNQLKASVGDYLTFKDVNGLTVYSPITGGLLKLKVVSINNEGVITVDQTVTTGDTSLSFPSCYAEWEYASQFQGAPIDSDTAQSAGVTNDGLHVVVVDADGKISGIKGKVLEAFENLSKMPNSKKSDGTVAFYKTALRASKWIWWMDHPTSGELSADGLDFGAAPVSGSAYKSLISALTKNLSGGADDYVTTPGAMITALGVYNDLERYTIRQLFTGNVDVAVANYALSVASARRDCVAYISPFSGPEAAPIIGDTEESVNAILEFRSMLTSTSYGVIDNGVKYQYDKFCDCYRWIALAGDTAGVAARTIKNANEWSSPAGYNRGTVKNVTRLGFNPKKAFRDLLFPKDVNSIVLTPKNGPVLLSDKTLCGRPSDFDAIGVRNLFILLEQTIADTAKFYLFEQNTETTQKLFVSAITPFLRDIQGRGGIEEFYVDVGPSVNTASVKQSKTFAANIYIRPTKVIRFIKLNFIATPEGVSFSEITGQ